MFAVERQKYICDTLERDGSAAINDLAAALDVSAETIRRDLLALEEQGKLSRIHGGAVRKIGVPEHKSLSTRLDSRTKEKAELSEYACSFINNGDFIAIDCGSTAVKLAEAIAKRFSFLNVITNSLDVFNILRTNKGIKLVLIGGNFDEEENGFSGLNTIEMIKRYNVSKFFMFPSGISLKFGITGYGEDICYVQKAFFEISDEIYVLADSEKFEKRAFEKTAETDKSYTYITDSSLSDVIKQSFIDEGMKIVSCADDLKRSEIGAGGAKNE